MATSVAAASSSRVVVNRLPAQASEACRRAATATPRAAMAAMSEVVRNRGDAMAGLRGLRVRAPSRYSPAAELYSRREVEAAPTEGWPRWARRSHGRDVNRSAARNLGTADAGLTRPCVPSGGSESVAPPPRRLPPFG